MSAIILFEKGGIRDAVYFQHGDTLAQVEVLAQQLHSYSHAAITRISATQKQLLTWPETIGDYASVSLKAKLLFRDTDEDTIWGIILPAPFADMFEEVAYQGFRVKKDVGDQLAVYYTQFTGLPLAFKEGWLIGGKQ